MTNDPQFTEMNHHFVTEFYGGPHAVADPCNLKRPVGAGSELTTLAFPSGYGFSANEEFLHGWQWHWANPNDVSIPANASVYIRFTLRFHVTSAQAYNDTKVAWLHANSGTACDPHLCVGSGGSTVTGPDYTAATAGRIVLAMPHVHDHATAIRLMRRVSGNPTTVKSFDTFNDIEYDAAHACDHENEVAWHNHDGTQDTGHLPVGGHDAWAPGSGGPTFSSGDKFYAEAAFDNPHEESIDNMAIVVIFTAAN